MVTLKSVLFWGLKEHSADFRGWKWGQGWSSKGHWPSAEMDSAPEDTSPTFVMVCLLKWSVISETLFPPHFGATFKTPLSYILFFLLNSLGCMKKRWRSYSQIFQKAVDSSVVLKQNTKSKIFRADETLHRMFSKISVHERLLPSGVGSLEACSLMRIFFSPHKQAKQEEDKNSSLTSGLNYAHLIREGGIFVFTTTAWGRSSSVKEGSYI